MKCFLFAAALFYSLAAPAQYYYKDIVGTRESSDLIKSYTKNKVSRVVLTSFDAKSQRDEEFYVEQLFAPANRSLTTTTSAQSSAPSRLISYADEKGNVVRTVDSSDIVVSITTYTYNEQGQLVSLISTAADTSAAAADYEQHLWTWKDGQPSKMLRIKNHKDTTFVTFKVDEQGNVVEESQLHNYIIDLPIYYYYNDKHQMTDVVHYSERVGQLLPEYMFEYNDQGQVSQKITVPARNSQYLIWRYQYNGYGLKTKEVIYDKQKKMTGRIQYQYSFGS